MAAGFSDGLDLCGCLGLFCGMRIVVRSASIRAVLVAAAILAAVSVGGCGGVTRQLSVKTEPSGALVELNDEEIGLSPVTVSFSWYGHYRVRISKEGYQTLNTHRQLKAPWYDAFPFDFVLMFLWPQQSRQCYEWNFELMAGEPVDRQQLIDAARKLQQEALVELAAPAHPAE
jgi:hypothetical protein